MSTYEILTIIISGVMTLTSVISCIRSSKIKKDVLAEKGKIIKIISNMNFEENTSDSVINSGENKGVMAKNISGGAHIGSKE